MSYDQTALAEVLKLREGTGPMKNGRHMPYEDSVGKLTIGYGHNIEDNGLPPTIAGLLLDYDIGEAEQECDQHLPWWRQQTPARQAALVHLMFNMGWGGGKRGLSTFRNTLKAFQEGRFAEAAQGFADSAWAKQVGPNRANPVIAQIRNG